LVVHAYAGAFQEKIYHSCCLQLAISISKCWWYTKT
jgi:hypothetical protein